MADVIVDTRTAEGVRESEAQRARKRTELLNATTKEQLATAITNMDSI